MKKASKQAKHINDIVNGIQDSSSKPSNSSSSVSCPIFSDKNTNSNIDPLLNNNLNQTFSKRTYLLSNDVRKLLLGMTIHNKINTSSIYTTTTTTTTTSNESINKMLLELYDIALTHQLKSVNIEKADIEKAFFYIQQLKPHYTESEVKTYLELIIKESTLYDFFKENTMKLHSMNSNKYVSLSDKLKNITNLSSSECRKLLSPIQEGELFSIHTFKSIATKDNSLLLVPSTQEENYSFKVPIDAILIDKKHIKLFLNDDYCDHLIRMLTNVNLSIEERLKIWHEINDKILLLESKVHTSHKTYPSTALNLLMHEWNYPQSKLVITNNSEWCFKKSVDFVNKMSISEKQHFVYEAATDPSKVALQQATKLYTRRSWSDLGLPFPKIDKENVFSSLKEISSEYAFQKTIMNHNKSSINLITKFPMSHTHEYNNSINSVLNINYNASSVIKSNRIKGFYHEKSMMYNHIKGDIDVSYLSNMVDKTIDKKAFSEYATTQFMDLNPDLNLSRNEIFNIKKRVFNLLNVYTKTFLFNDIQKK